MCIRDRPWGRAGAQSRIVREQDEPHRLQDLLKNRVPGGCADQRTNWNSKVETASPTSQMRRGTYNTIRQVMTAGRGVAPSWNTSDFLDFSLISRCADNGCTGPQRQVASKLVGGLVGTNATRGPPSGGIGSESDGE